MVMALRTIDTLPEKRARRAASKYDINPFFSDRGGCNKIRRRTTGPQPVTGNKIGCHILPWYVCPQLLSQPRAKSVTTKYHELAFFDSCENSSKAVREII